MYYRIIILETTNFNYTKNRIFLCKLEEREYMWHMAMENLYLNCYDYNIQNDEQWSYCIVQFSINED